MNLERYRAVDDNMFNLEFGDWDVGKQENQRQILNSLK
jgi:hypothetical protein